MAQLFANNATGTLASGITNVQTSIALTSGHGARFPSPTGGDYFYATLFQRSGGTEINHEIIKVTARSTDTLTVTRAQEGTTGKAFNALDPIELRLTTGFVKDMALSGTTTGITASMLGLGSGANVSLGVSSAHNVALKANNVDRLTVGSDGRIWAADIHDNGDVSSQFVQYIASGTYTPVGTGITNIDACSNGAANFIRVGNVVSVAGVIYADPTSLGVASRFSMTLPTGSFLNNPDSCGGFGFCSGAGATAMGYWIGYYNGSAYVATFYFTAPVTVSHQIYFNFQYLVNG